MAPEVIENLEYTLKADVFSFGVKMKFKKCRSLFGKYVQEKLHTMTCLNNRYHSS